MSYWCITLAVSLLLFVSLPCFGGAKALWNFSASPFGDKLPEFVENLKVSLITVRSAILIKCALWWHLSERDGSGTNTASRT